MHSAIRRIGFWFLLAVPIAVTWTAIAKDPRPTVGFKIGNATFRSQEAFVASGARCATPELAPGIRAAVEQALQNRKVDPAAENDVLIPVQFIHITDGSQGVITEQQRLDQIQVLNDAYAGLGFQFCYDPQAFPVKTVDNPTWYRMYPGTPNEYNAKSALHEDADTVLNFYTCSPTGGLLGWATFPFPNIDQVRDGVVILDESLPGGNASPYNLGDTATHEVGHWLGLYHTFQNGCLGSGDEVSDTIAHPNSDFGCPSCGPVCTTGCSPTENFMNYTDDACMTEFTAGQGTRMRNIVAQYRPQLGSVACDGSGGGGGGGCTLARLAEEANKFFAFPLSGDDLDALRRYRDLVLKKSEVGRPLVAMYYQHGAELTQILLKNPSLAAESLLLVSRQVPAVERALGSNTAVELSTTEFQAGITLLQRCRSSASPKLQQSLQQVETLLASVVETQGNTVTLNFASAPASKSVALSGYHLRPIPDPRFE